MSTNWNVNPDPVFGPNPVVPRQLVQEQFEKQMQRERIEAAIQKLNPKAASTGMTDDSRWTRSDPNAEAYRAASVIAGRALSAALTNPAILSLLLADDTGLAAAKLAKLVVDVASDVAVQLRAKVPEKLSLENPP